MILKEGNSKYPTRRVPCKMKATTGGGADIHFEGYGENSMPPGYGAPVYVELYEGKLMLYVWADINSEEPTHKIDLEGAKETARKS